MGKEAKNPNECGQGLHISVQGSFAVYNNRSVRGCSQVLPWILIAVVLIPYSVSLWECSSWRVVSMLVQADCIQLGLKETNVFFGFCPHSHAILFIVTCPPLCQGAGLLLMCGSHSAAPTADFHTFTNSLFICLFSLTPLVLITAFQLTMPTNNVLALSNSCCIN